METFGQHRHKISSFSSDHTLIDLLPSTAPSSFRGNRNLQKQRNFPKLASDSSSCRSDTTDEDQLTFELTSTSSKQSTWTPMKKLLVGEMSKENESRRRPSVIARLMGLDGLLPQQPGHRQQKGIESSCDKVRKGNTLNGRQSSRKCSKEEHEFKDVFEVLGALEMEIAGYSSQRTANSNLYDAEVAFIRQKFMEAKHLSTDEKLQDSEEFNDTLEVLNSNTDLLLKFFQQPDSLFTKHLHDLQGLPPQSHFGRVSAMKSSRTLNNEDASLALKDGRETRTKRHFKSPQGHQKDCLSHTHGRFAAHNPSKSPTFQSEEKNGPAIVPTRIVVLKPNLGKLQNTSKTVSSSPRSSHHFPSKCTRHSEILCVYKDAEVWGKNNVHQDTGFQRHNTRDSREMAKEIARKMKNSFNNNSMTISTSTLRGYAGVGSSCDATGSESANDSDVTALPYRNNIDWKKRHRRSSSRSSESSVSREAKKRLSERWKLTNKSQEVHVVSRGSTLGEMLATSDREVIPANSSGLVGVEGCNKLGRHVEPAVCNEPLGISSRDGWKDGCLGNLSRSRSLPASSTNFGSPRVCARHESILRDKYVIPKESFKWDRNKAVKGKLNQKEAPLPSNRSSCVKASQFCGSSCSDEEYSDTQQDSDISPYQVKQNKQSEQILMVSGGSVGTVVDSSSVLQNEADVNDLDNSVLSEPSHMELSPPASLNAVVASTSDLDNLNSQESLEGPSTQTTPHCPVSELSPASSKEAEQPSPVSVIEAPFADDASSASECFESISADLHELRMQLRQLKLESEAYEEGTMFPLSDDDSNEVSVWLAEDNGRPKAEENWESAYIVDVLVDSGIGRDEPDSFLAAWHSPECPVDPLVFQELEKKYCNVNSCSRVERRLMFDRINSMILEIYQQCRDQPWVMSGKKIIIPKCNIEELEDSLRKSLASQNKKPHMVLGEMVFAGEPQWLDLRSDIDKIGRGIERLLVDELVSEVVAG